MEAAIKHKILAIETTNHFGTIDYYRYYMVFAMTGQKSFENSRAARS